MMKKSVTLLAALLMLAVAAAPAFAMTKQKAKQLGQAAYHGSTAALTHLEAVAMQGLKPTWTLPTFLTRACRKTA